MLKNSTCKNNNSFISGKGFIQIRGVKSIKFSDGELTDGCIVFEGTKTTRYATCPYCSYRSRSVHSHYARKIIDKPISGINVIIKLTVRRFRCKNEHCPYTAFSEQFPDLTSRYARRTHSLTSYLQQLLMEISSVKGSYICSITGIKQSPSTCLRVVRTRPVEIEYDTVKHLGIDDFAYRKGVSYGTIIVDCDTCKPIKLISGRDAESVKPALEKFHSVETISRDRASAFSKAIESTHSEASQVADRFHLIKNCGDHVSEQIKRMIAEIKAQVSSNIYGEQPCSESQIEVSRFYSATSKIQETIYGEIHRLHGLGLSQRAIARELKVERKTVQKYLQCETVPRKVKTFKIDYDRYLPTINDGVKNRLPKAQIYRTVVESGLRCRYNTFVNWMKTAFPEYKGQRGHNAKLGDSPVKSRSVFTSEMDLETVVLSGKLHIYVCNPEWGINKHTGECSKEHERMEQIISSSQILKDLRTAFLSFKAVLLKGRTEDLDAWITLWQTSDYPKLKSFAKGMLYDLEAVKNAIKYTYSNGLVEGLNNKLKSIKRGMYGRAGRDLLEIKMVHSVTG